MQVASQRFVSHSLTHFVEAQQKNSKRSETPEIGQKKVQRQNSKMETKITTTTTAENIIVYALRSHKTRAMYSLEYIKRVLHTHTLNPFDRRTLLLSIL